MLQGSQPLDPKAAKKMGLEDINTVKNRPEPKIISERIGRMFDDLSLGKRKIGLKTRLECLRKDIRGFYHDVRYIFATTLNGAKLLVIYARGKVTMECYAL
jgi:hypothetical protein